MSGKREALRLWLEFSIAEKDNRFKMIPAGYMAKEKGDSRLSILGGILESR